MPPTIPVPTTKFGAWANIVQANRLTDLPNASTIFNTRKLTNMVKFAISDSGASAHFLLEGAPVVNKKVAEYPIAIKLPDGTIIYSTHTCNLEHSMATRCDDRSPYSSRPGPFLIDIDQKVYRCRMHSNV